MERENMGDVLVKSGTLVMLIVLGYVLKRIGLFTQQDSKTLSKIMIYVTLPGIVLNAMKDFTMNMDLLSMMFINIVSCIIMAFFGWVVIAGVTLSTAASEFTELLPAETTQRSSMWRLATHSIRTAGWNTMRITMFISGMYGRKTGRICRIAIPP